MKMIFNIAWIMLAGLNPIKAQTDINYQPKLLLRELDNLSRGKHQMSELFSLDKSIHIKQGKFFKIGDEVTPDLTGYVYVGRVNTCRSGGCSAPQKDSEHTSEYFDYFILFDVDGKVRMVRVFDYQATHGQEITSASWLKQFAGYTGEGGITKEIDAISGATISVTAITYDIQDKTRLLKEVVLSRPSHGALK